MKYELTQSEKQKINAGEIITFAAYTPQKAALCEYVANRNDIKFKYEKSESPTGRQIFVFFLYPNTFYKAFHAGAMLERENLYKEEFEKYTSNWAEVFNLLTPTQK